MVQAPLNRMSRSHQLGPELPANLPLPRIRQTTLVQLVVTSEFPRRRRPQFLQAGPTGDFSYARRNGLNGAGGQRCHSATPLLCIDVLHSLPRRLGMLKEFLHVSPEEIPPYPHRGVGGNGDISHQNKNTQNYLLEPSQSVQIDCIQTRIGHSTGAKEEGVNITKLEVRFSVATVSIDTAAVHDDRREDDGEEEVNDMHAIEVDLEAAMPAQKTLMHSTDATHSSGDSRRESSKKKKIIPSEVTCRRPEHI